MVICFCIFDSDSNRLFSCSWDSSIIQWDLVDVTKPVSVCDRAHSSEIFDISFGNESANTLLSVGCDGFFRTWDMRMNMNNGCVMIVNLGMAGSGDSIISYDLTCRLTLRFNSGDLFGI